MVKNDLGDCVNGQLLYLEGGRDIHTLGRRTVRFIGWGKNNEVTSFAYSRAAGARRRNHIGHIQVKSSLQYFGSQTSNNQSL